MELLLIGIGMFVVGTVINAVGWSIDRKTRMMAPELVEWLVGEFAKHFTLLVSRNATTGERVASFGAIISALGLAIAVVGLATLAA